MAIRIDTTRQALADKYGSLGTFLGLATRRSRCGGRPGQRGIRRLVRPGRDDLVVGRRRVGARHGVHRQRQRRYLHLRDPVLGCDRRHHDRQLRHRQHDPVDRGADRAYSGLCPNMSLAAAGDGTLTIAVWPTYVGACQRGSGPWVRSPTASRRRRDTSAVRSNGAWRKRPSWAAPFIHAGAGLLHASGLLPRSRKGPCMCGKIQLPHPILFPRARRDRDLPDHQLGSGIC